MRTIIAFDDHINNNNKYLFQNCSDNARQISVERHITHTLVDSSRLNKDDVYNIVQEQGEEDFLFAAFSHGGENTLVCTDIEEPYISCEINSNIFQGKIVYTYACCAGKRLGSALINNGAKAFIGYTEEVWTSLRSPEAFADCATYGINAILDGRNLNECIEEMKRKYTREYDNILASDPLGAGYLLESREALVLLV